MTEEIGTSWVGNAFKAVNVGQLKDLDAYSYTLPASSMTIDGKLFLNVLLGLTGSEISFNKLPPKTSMPFYHKHQAHEEVYIFLSGEGQFQIDEKVFPVKEGTVVRVNPEGERTWRNVSDSTDLTFLVIQSPAGQMEVATTEDGLPIEKRVSWVNKEEASLQE